MCIWKTECQHTMNGGSSSKKCTIEFVHGGWLDSLDFARDYKWILLPQFLLSSSLYSRVRNAKYSTMKECKSKTIRTLTGRKKIHQMTHHKTYLEIKTTIMFTWIPMFAAVFKATAAFNGCQTEFLEDRIKIRKNVIWSMKFENL